MQGRGAGGAGVGRTGVGGCAGTAMSMSDTGQDPVPNPPRYGRIAPAAHKDDFPVPQNVSPSQPRMAEMQTQPGATPVWGAAWPTRRELGPSGGSQC